MSRTPQESSCASTSSTHGNTLSSGERCPIESHLQRYLSRPSIGLVKGMLYGERVNINKDGAILDEIQRQSRSLIGSPEVATFLTGIGIKLCLQRVTRSREALDTQQGQVHTEEQVLHAIIRGHGDGLSTGRTITVVKALAVHIRAFLPTSSTWTGLAFEPSSSLRQAYGFLCICITASDIYSHSGSPIIQRYGELRCSGIPHEAALGYVGSLWSSTVLHLGDVVTLLARVHRVCLHSPCNPAAFPLLLSLVSNSCVVWLYLSHRWLYHTLRTENAYFHTPRLYCAHSSLFMMFHILSMEGEVGSSSTWKTCVSMLREFGVAADTALASFKTYPVSLTAAPALLSRPYEFPTQELHRMFELVSSIECLCGLRSL